MFRKLYYSEKFICGFAGCGDDAHYLITFTCCSVTGLYCLKDCNVLDTIYEKGTVKCVECANIKKFDTVTYV